MESDQKTTLEATLNLKSRSRPEKLWINTNITPSSSKELLQEEEEEEEEDLFNEVAVRITHALLYNILK